MDNLVFHHILATEVAMKMAAAGYTQSHLDIFCASSPDHCASSSGNVMEFNNEEIDRGRNGILYFQELEE